MTKFLPSNNTVRNTNLSLWLKMVHKFGLDISFKSACKKQLDLPGRLSTLSKILALLKYVTDSFGTLKLIKLILEKKSFFVCFFP